MLGLIIVANVATDLTLLRALWSFVWNVFFIICRSGHL